MFHFTILNPTKNNPAVTASAYENIWSHTSTHPQIKSCLCCWYVDLHISNWHKCPSRSCITTSLFQWSENPEKQQILTFTNATRLKCGSSPNLMLVVFQLFESSEVKWIATAADWFNFTFNTNVEIERMLLTRHVVYELVCVFAYFRPIGVDVAQSRLCVFTFLHHCKIN